MIRLRLSMNIILTQFSDEQSRDLPCTGERECFRPLMDMQPSTLSSRIRESAVGLTRDLLLNSTNGYGALETTNELSTLRSARKLSTTPSHGTSSSSSQLPALLNNRQHYGNEAVRCSECRPDLNATPDAEEELSDFLLQKCNMKVASASSSRSASTLDLTSIDGGDSERWHGHHLKRNDSFEPEMSRSKQKSPAQVWHADAQLSQHDNFHHDSTLNSVDWNGDLGHSSSKTSDDSYQKLFSGHQSQEFAVKSASDIESARRKERALSRLHLVFSQMPAAAQPQSAPDLRQANPFESSYNQLCGGEGAQEWAEFEASLFRAYSDQTQTDEQSISQGQQHKQNSVMSTGRQASLRANLDQSHMLRHSELSRDVLPQQKQAATNKDKEQSTSKEPIAGFHCPWVDCHSVSLWGHSST